MKTSTELLEYIALTKDKTTLTKISFYKEKLFIEPEELELYEVIESTYNKNGYILDLDSISSYKLSKEANKLLKGFGKVEDILESMGGSEGAEEATNILLYNSYSDYLSIEARRQLTELSKAPIQNIEELTDEYISGIHGASRYSKLLENKEILIHGDEYLEKLRSSYSARKVSDDISTISYGYSFLDESLGGIEDTDFIQIISYVKGFKSTFMRNTGYNTLLQCRNVLVVTLEMSEEEVEADYLSLHASNPSVFGKNRPIVKSKQIRKAELSEEAEEYLFEEVAPHFANSEDMGILKILNPTDDDYYFSDLTADIDKVTQEMDIHLIILDYLTLIKASRLNSRDEVNSMFKSLRKYILKKKIPLINAVQANRESYNNMLEDEQHRYSPDSASDYNEIERSSTVMISTAQTPEMENSAHLLIAPILSRGERIERTPVKTLITPARRIVEVSQNLSSEEAAEQTEEILSDLELD